LFFEFINGFHDTANAVATVIYTHSLPPTVAVIWSGLFMEWVRGILILTCTGVSFAHGSNDGQKGMGLFMLVLIIVLPSALAHHARAVLRHRRYHGCKPFRPAKEDVA
jgi:phosphate/sulfate permease